MNKLTILALTLLTACGGGGSSTDKCTVAIYGDSVANGYSVRGSRFDPTPAEYLAQLTGYTVTDYSYNGASVLNAKLLGTQQIVVARFGVADSALRTPIEQYQAAYKQFPATLIIAPTYAKNNMQLPYYFGQYVDISHIQPEMFDGLHPTESYSRKVTEYIAQKVIEQCTH